MAHDCAQLERKNIPAVVLVSAGFEEDLEASARAFGMPALSSVTVPYVYNNATEADCITQSRAAVNDLMHELTTAPERKDSEERRRYFVFHTTDDSSLVREFTRFADERDLGDGYPLWPPTRAAVDRLVDEAGVDPSEEVCVLPPGNGQVDVEGLAAACVMAGCNPGEMIVVEAALRALSSSDYSRQVRAGLMSTGAHAPLFVVNGPFAEKIGINGGRGCIGPGAQNQVNNRIGRAVLLTLKNLGSWYPGVMDLDTIGTVRKNIVVVRENESESPWVPLHTEFSFQKADDVVSLFFTKGEWDVGFQGHLSPQQLAEAIASFTGAQGGYFSNLFGGRADGVPTAGRLLLVAPSHAQVLEDGGISKEQFRQILFDGSAEPIKRLVESTRKLYATGKVEEKWRWAFELEPDEQSRRTLPAIPLVENYSVVVCGSTRGKDLCMPTYVGPITAALRADWLARATL